MANKNRRRKRSGGLNTNYLTKMGFHNLVANRSMSLSSVSVLTACLLLIGISFILLFNIQNLVKDVEKQNVVVAFVKADADEFALNKVNTDLNLIPNVTEVKFVSKEEAFKDQMQELGLEQQMLEGVIDNPLPDAYQITVSNIDLFNETLAAIKAVENIDTVRESQEIVNQISTLQASITAICLIMVVVLLIVSLFIIANTIRITMVARKIDIQVMKSVGATNMFICWPFMIEGVMIGLISGVIAFGLTCIVEKTEGEAIGSLFGLFGSQAIALSELLPYLIVGYLVSGIFLGSFGSVVSIRKYLKKEGSEAEELL
ncbi:MAG: permease-like cell division protein FtsX [Clostridia bacterium]|nr:permease-like cell division protein FtsX [Clostridia bacterium]